MKPLGLNTIENPGFATIERPSRAEKADGDGFGQTLKAAIKAPGGDVVGRLIEKVDAAQTDADLEAQKLGNGEGNLHETMLALEKADVTMRVAMKVRNKFLEAYNEVMRMPV